MVEKETRSFMQDPRNIRMEIRTTNSLYQGAELTQCLKDILIKARYNLTFQNKNIKFNEKILGSL